MNVGRFEILTLSINIKYYNLKQYFHLLNNIDLYLSKIFIRQKLTILSFSPNSVNINNNNNRLHDE